MTQAIIYARFSPRPTRQKRHPAAQELDQERPDCDSADKQLDRCRAYCQSRDYLVVGEYADEYKSGEDDNRPDLQCAIEHACRCRAVLVVYKLDRLARDTRDCLEIVERLQEHKADLASLTETINTRSALGRFFLTILAAFAELERFQIAERTSMAMLRHQANGRRMTRPDRCPYGWQPDASDPNRIVEDATEQAAIDRIAEERRQGKGLREIARALERAGVTCRGRPCRTRPFDLSCAEPGSLP